MYSSVSNKLLRSISRFKDVAYGAHFRKDGQLLVAGGEAKAVQVFDLSSRVILRTFEGHTKAVHHTEFSESGIKAFSCSDDKSVRLWDLSSEKEERCFEGHEDYVRTGAITGAGEHLFLTGSYDHTVRLWDSRAKDCVLKVDHGAPVEAVLWYPHGNSFISAGGNRIKVWDALGTSRNLYSLSNHQKTITSLCFDKKHTRLLSGSLDQQVKIYDVSDFKVVHSIKYSAPILSVALSPRNTHLVVGMSSGLLAIRRRPVVEQSSKLGPKKRPKVGTYRYFVRGHDHKATTTDVVVYKRKKKKLKIYDKLLKKFKYYEALDACMNKGTLVVQSVLYELVQRGALKQALGGRDESSIKPILQFVARYISNPRYTALLIDVGSAILDLYGPVMGQSPAIDECFLKLHRKLVAEVEFQQRLLELMGSLDLLLSATDTDTRAASTAQQIQGLQDAAAAPGLQDAGAK